MLTKIAQLENLVVFVFYSSFIWVKIPGLEQCGSRWKVNSMPDVQVTSLLPEFIAPESEHVTSTTVPGSTGNCVVVFSMCVNSSFSPVQSGCTLNNVNRYIYTMCVYTTMYIICLYYACIYFSWSQWLLAYA